jgi:hypothetical protein
MLKWSDFRWYAEEKMVSEVQAYILYEYGVNLQRQ